MDGRNINLNDVSAHMTQKVPIAVVAMKIPLNQDSVPGSGIKSTVPANTRSHMYACTTHTHSCVKLKATMLCVHFIAILLIIWFPTLQ